MRLVIMRRAAAIARPAGRAHIVADLAHRATLVRVERVALLGGDGLRDAFGGQLHDEAAACDGYRWLVTQWTGVPAVPELNGARSFVSSSRCGNPPAGR